MWWSGFVKGVHDHVETDLLGFIFTVLEGEATALRGLRHHVIRALVDVQVPVRREP